MNPNRYETEQQKLLHEVGILEFIVVELTLYLDTHPEDQEAMEYFHHYNRLCNQAKKEYSARFEPLEVEFMDTDHGDKWKWSTSKMPWEGGC